MHLDVGGPTYQMQLGGKLRPFEMHPVFGPYPLHAVTGDPLTVVPPGFWDAIERWKLGGELLDGGRCIIHEWCMACDKTGDEVKHLGGKHWQIVGKCKVCEGRKIVARPTGDQE